MAAGDGDIGSQWIDGIGNFVTQTLPQLGGQAWDYATNDWSGQKVGDVAAGGLAGWAGIQTLLNYLENSRRAKQLDRVARSPLPVDQYMAPMNAQYMNALRSGVYGDLARRGLQDSGVGTEAMARQFGLAQNQNYMNAAGLAGQSRGLQLQAMGQRPQLPAPNLGPALWWLQNRGQFGPKPSGGQPGQRQMPMGGSARTEEQVTYQPGAVNSPGLGGGGGPTTAMDIYSAGSGEPAYFWPPAPPETYRDWTSDR